MGGSWTSWIAALVVVGALAAHPGTARSATEVIVLTGDTAPDGNGTFSTFQAPALNDQQEVAFNATLTGTVGGNSDNVGIFRGDVSTLTTIFREGQADPSGNGDFSNFFTRPVINDAGEVVIFIGLTGSNLGVNDDSGIYRGDGTTLVTIVRENQTVPGGNGAFASLQGHALNDVGEVAFNASLRNTSGGSSDDEGVYRSDGTTVVEIVRRGDSAPVTGAFADFNADPTLNDSGEVAFHGVVDVGTAIWNMYRFDTGGITPIAREGEPAPEGNFLIIDTNPALNESGDVAFEATLDGTSGGLSDDVGIFVGAGGAIGTIVREGDSALGGTFSDFLNEIDINATGMVVFTGILAGPVFPANRGIYRGDGGGAPVEVVRGGDVAPDGNGTVAAMGTPAINDAGQVAYSAVFTGTSRGSTDTVGVFLFDDPMVGTLTVARTGDAFLGSTITELSFHPGDPSSPEGSGLNNAGEVAYGFELADGRQGIAIRTVPEPSKQWLSAIACLTLSFLARRR